MVGKVAVLGGSDFVLPFSALGLDTFPVEENQQEIVNKAQEIKKGDYALIVVAENVARAAEEVFGDLHNNAIPGIVVVPFTQEPSGFATESLGEALKRATGIDILKTG